MSVVVRMEMPKSCPCELAGGYDIPLPCFAGHGIPKRCKEFDECVENGRKPDWCPFVCSLPEGHGRLIDADAMEKDLNYDVELDAKAFDDMSIVGYARERFKFDKNRKQDCIRYLSGQKTIVPAERREV